MKLIQLAIKYCKKTIVILLISLMMISTCYSKDISYSLNRESNNIEETSKEKQLEEYQISNEVKEKLLKKAKISNWEKFDDIMKEGREFVVIDYYTGYYWACVRWMGGNHADVETVDKEATASLRRVNNDRENWKRRPVLIVFSDGSVYCASSFVVDHAGVDGAGFLKEVDNRSRGYGTGMNLDKVTGNDANGHYCIFVWGCTNHYNGKPNKEHNANLEFLKNEKERLNKGE